MRKVNINGMNWELDWEIDNSQSETAFLVSAKAENGSSWGEWVDLKRLRMERVDRNNSANWGTCREDDEEALYSYFDGVLERLAKHLGYTATVNASGEYDGTAEEVTQGDREKAMQGIIDWIHR